MAPIDPKQLLSTLSVLLGNHGGIKSQDEVTRLVALMEKFSKKMVSKIVYINILRATRQDVLEKFLNEKGWNLVNFWFSESIKAQNWPLVIELLRLFLQCPMTIERLRENVEVNCAPKLVRHLAARTDLEPDFNELAKQVLQKWMSVIQCPPVNPATQTSAPLTTRTRGQRNTSTTPPPTEEGRFSPVGTVGSGKTVVTVFTDTVEIVRLLNMQCQVLEQQEPQFWHGRGGKTAKIQAKLQKAAATAAAKAEAKKPKAKLTIKIAGVVESFDAIKEMAAADAAIEAVNKSDKDYNPVESEEDEPDDDDESDDDLAQLLARSDRAVNNRDRKYGAVPVKKPAVVVTKKKDIATTPGGGGVTKPEIKRESVIKSLVRADSVTSPGSPLKNEVNMMETGNQSSILHDELMDVDELLKDDIDETKVTSETKVDPLGFLKDLADGVAKDLEKEKEKEDKQKEKEKESVKGKEKDKENKDRKSSSSDHKKKDRHRDKDRHKDRDKDRGKDRERDREKDKDREKRRDHERRRKEREEKRRKEKEKERERKEKLRREPKPFKETEMRNGLDSKQKEKIKEVVQRLKDEDEAKKNEPKSSPTVEKPKPIKKDFPTVDKAGKSALSFDALMGGMDFKKTIKAPPIKNKNKDLLASFSSSNLLKKDSPKEEKKLPNINDVFKMRTEDKSSKIIPASDFLKERKAIKRPAESTLDPPKIKIKSPAQLKESNGFNDFLSNIMKDDQPKKKVIKIAELKQKTEEEERAKKREEELREVQNKDSEAKDDDPEAGASTGGLSFYRDTLIEDNTKEETIIKSPVDERSPMQEDVEIPEEEQVPRDVRGQLVIARGTVRLRKRVSWPEDPSLVKVKFFELDETERVNVNKLKFEEMRKKELEFEKSAINERNMLAVEEARPWPALTTCDFTPPEIEYGGQSLEKVTQEKRENSVLQALYFNSLPSNPSEPENASTLRFETKDIPLEDESQEETFMDYSRLVWPAPLNDRPTHESKSSLSRSAPQTDIFARLQSMMGGGSEDAAPLPPVKVATEMEMIKQGLLPPQPPQDDMNGQHAFIPGPNEPYEPYDEENMMNNPHMMHYNQTGPPYQDGWAGGDQHDQYQPHQQQQHYGGGPQYPQRSNWRGGNGYNNRGNNRGGFGGPRGRGYQDGFNRGGQQRGRGFDRGHDRGMRRGKVCKYWYDRGYCRDGDRCLFLHPPR